MRRSRHAVLFLLAVTVAIWVIDVYVENRPATDAPQNDAHPLAAVLEAIEKPLGLSLPETRSEKFEKNEKLLALLAPYVGQSYTFPPRTQTAGCEVRGSLPDPECSPGAVFAVGTSTICVSGYTKTVRNVSVSTKKKLYAAYGIPYPQPTGTYEADHLIPLALGGNNDLANLFPEARDPWPGFREKDLVENYLRQQVCAGVVDLAAAQRQIAENWVAVYETLSPDTLQTLRNQFRNWSDSGQP